MTYPITQRVAICSTMHMQVQSMPVAAGNARVISSLMKWIICRIRLTMFCAEEAGCFRAHLSASMILHILKQFLMSGPMEVQIESCRNCFPWS